jgi:hypothetical protein
MSGVWLEKGNDRVPGEWARASVKRRTHKKSFAARVFSSISARPMGFRQKRCAPRIIFAQRLR